MHSTRAISRSRVKNLHSTHSRVPRFYTVSIDKVHKTGYNKAMEDQDALAVIIGKNITRLRRKIGPYGEYIVTRQGYGYGFKG